MSLPKKGKPIPGDLARKYLRDIAEGLRAEARSGRHSKSFYRAATGGYIEPAFELAASVLEAVADGEKEFGHLIERRGLGQHYQQAVTAVCRAAIDARFKGERITREEAYRRADEALGRSDSKRLFLAYQRHHDHIIELPFKGVDSPSWPLAHDEEQKRRG